MPANEVRRGRELAAAACLSASAAGWRAGWARSNAQSVGTALVRGDASAPWARRHIRCRRLGAMRPPRTVPWQDTSERVACPQLLLPELSDKNGSIALKEHANGLICNLAWPNAKHQMGLLGRNSHDTHDQHSNGSPAFHITLSQHSTPWHMGATIRPGHRASRAANGHCV